MQEKSHRQVLKNLSHLLTRRRRDSTGPKSAFLVYIFISQILTRYAFFQYIVSIGAAKLLYRLPLPFFRPIRIALVFRRERPSIRGLAEEHLRYADPIAAVTACEDCFC